MNEVLKIFLGSNGKTDFDSVELLRMGRVAEKEGFVLFKTAQDLVNNFLKKSFIPPTLHYAIVRGGWAERCVASATEDLFSYGIIKVACDLPNIRSYTGNNNEAFLIGAITANVENKRLLTKIEFIGKKT